MKPLIRLASLCVALTFATPMPAATLSFERAIADRHNKIEDQFPVTLGLGLGTRQFSKEPRYLSRHNAIARLGSDIRGKGNPTPTQRSTVGTDTLMANLIFSRSRTVTALSDQRNGRFFADKDLTLMSIETGHFWDSAAQIGLGAPMLTNVTTSQLMTLPLPATFPMLLSVCLGAAFFGRKRQKS